MDANQFISQHLFDGIVELKISQSYIPGYGSREELDNYVTISIVVDHNKLWRGSKNFNEKYYDYIVDIDNGIYDGALTEISPMVGFNHDTGEDVVINYIHKNVNVYSVLEDKILDLGYVNKLEVIPFVAWASIYISCDDISDLYFIRETLDSLGYDTDDIILSDDF